MYSISNLEEETISVYVYLCVCMYVCMYVYFNEWGSNKVLVRLGLDTLIGCWPQLDTKYIVRISK